MQSHGCFCSTLQHVWREITLWCNPLVLRPLWVFVPHLHPSNSSEVSCSRVMSRLYARLLSMCPQICWKITQTGRIRSRNFMWPGISACTCFSESDLFGKRSYLITPTLLQNPHRLVVSMGQRLLLRQRGRYVCGVDKLAYRLLSSHQVMKTWWLAKANSKRLTPVVVPS